MLRGSRRALSFPCYRPQSNSRKIVSRNIATTQTASGDVSNLPLAGIKVLDMTRVLAGVSFAFVKVVDETYV
jgi:hypothetical protein